MRVSDSAELERLSVLAVLLIQAGAAFYWGGGLYRMVKQHDTEINGQPGGLRDSRHEHANMLTQHEARIGEIEHKVEGIEGREDRRREPR